jgi:tetratricopeptide (TPR) repeat protein
MDPTPADQETLNRQAVDAALNCDWEVAIKLNLHILETDPHSIPALNRLAKAYFQMGRYKDSKKMYSQVLDIDPYNPIAQKNVKILASFKKDGEEPANGMPHQKISASSFLQEPGVTKSVNLVKVAEPQKLSTLTAGMSTKIVQKARGIMITDQAGTYLGALPDDISHLLTRFLDGGNEYEALIKSVKPNGLTVLIKEVSRSKQFQNRPSFLEETGPVTYATDNIALLTDNSDLEAVEVEAEESDV